MPNVKNAGMKKRKFILKIKRCNFMMKYICYVDGNIDCFNTEEEALKRLKYYIDTGHDSTEWFEGIEKSFVAKVLYRVREKELNKFIEMEIVDIEWDEITRKTKPRHEAGGTNK